MGAVLSCSDDTGVTKPKHLYPRQEQSQYKPADGYFQPQQPGPEEPKYKPEWYKQDTTKKESEEPAPKSKAVPYQNQDYFQLKEHLLENKQLFVDPEFPPTDKSLFWSKKPPRGIKWKRPHEIVSNPKLFVDGVSASDFQQGSIGNCWFIAACCNIALQPHLVGQIIPEWQTQEWAPENKYCGLFHFHFFFFGRWIDVVIDDFLPTKNNRLVYCSSTSKNEFWSSLIEKAYAKLFGDYESLKSGHARDGMVDMTGGVGQKIVLEDAKKDFLLKAQTCTELQGAFKYGSLMSASIVTKAKSDFEKRMDCGLVMGHAYSITHCLELPQNDGTTIAMVRLRNPWGGKEWRGAWSDGSPEWRSIPDDEKRKIGLIFRDDGEFWMTYNDFLTHYDKIDICHMLRSPKMSVWKGRQSYGSLRKPDRCGGCVNYDSFLNNPQYMFQVSKQNAEVMIYMEQVDTRIWREYGVKEQFIGFSVLEANLSSGRRVGTYKRKIKSSTFLDTRSNFLRIRLPVGWYLLVPCTFDPNIEMTFLLRLYGQTDPNLSTELQ